METHVKVAGWLWAILGALTLLGAVCAVVGIAAGGLGSRDPNAFPSPAIAAAGGGGLLLLSGALNLLTGIGLLKFKSWARILAIIFAFLNLLAFPIGTALGVYTLWVMLSKETGPLFQS
jgi:hypothetical protein